MSEPLVFGEADPEDYMEPLCVECKHLRSEHHDAPMDDHPLTACWHGWTAKTEGCQCMEWTAAKEAER